MDRSSRTQGRDQKHTKFWLEDLKRKDHSEDLGADGKAT
jgi:hypothetical protein